MAVKQCTLKNKFTLKGRGLHTGKEVTITCKPAPVNFGYQFKRTDIKNDFLIPALAEYAVSSQRNTILEKKNVRIQTPEHLLSALYGLQIDNCLIEIDTEEIPILDGSAKPYVKAIENAGIQTQDSPRKYFIIDKPYYFRDNKHKAEISILPDNEFRIDVHIAFDAPFLENQFASLYNLNGYKDEIANCRTFVFFRELEGLYQNGLIKGGNFENALVFLDKKVTSQEYKRIAKLFNQEWKPLDKPGLINNTDLQFVNEPARHKLLDVIGDIALCGRFLKGRIVAFKPGHALNTGLAKLVRREFRTSSKKPPKVDIFANPIMDINQIKKRLPHRSPFLLVDKILELTETSIIGLKNVTFNEPFFVGHFPDEPIMPGVLIIEAIAQCGGIYILSKVKNPEKYSTYFAKIDDIKFRRKVIPGDTLLFSVNLLSEPRRNMVQMEGKAFVGNNLVTEGKFMAQVIKNK